MLRVINLNKILIEFQRKYLWEFINLEKLQKQENDQYVNLSKSEIDDRYVLFPVLA